MATIKYFANLIPLAEAQKLLTVADGTPVHHNTLLRWIKKGVGPRHNRIRLRATLVGKWLTSREWIEEFLSRRTEAALDAVDPYFQASESARRCEEAIAILAAERAACRTNRKSRKSPGEQPCSTTV